MEEFNSKVLLESGTNEFELIEFKICNRHFGINVAKVLEIMRSTEVMPMPNSNIFVEGIFKSRNDVISVVNLPKYLNLPEAPPENKDIFIITKFNGVSTAFHVHSVEGIKRISWESIDKPDKTIYGSEDVVATGIARLEDKLITILDFEKILTDINKDNGIKLNSSVTNKKICHKPIMIVEDSQMLMEMICECMENAGFVNLIRCNNGKDAYEKLLNFKIKNKPISNFVNFIITDIEMPQMDGHRLIKLINEDEVLKIIPTAIFSSLISEDVLHRGVAVGAWAQFAKPNMDELILFIEENIL